MAVMNAAHEIVRRPIAARRSRWAAALARGAIAAHLRPNQISALSIVWAAAAAAALAATPFVEARWRAAFLIVAAVLIQLRLLCNLLDGLMAVEGGLQTRSGEIYNDLPDRFSDA